MDDSSNATSYLAEGEANASHLPQKRRRVDVDVDVAATPDSRLVILFFFSPLLTRRTCRRASSPAPSDDSLLKVKKRKKANARRNKKYRSVLFFSSGLEMAQKLGSEDRKICLAQARELLAKGEPLPSNLQSVVDSDDKHREKQRIAAANKRELEKKKTNEIDQGRIPGPSSRVDNNPLKVPHPPAPNSWLHRVIEIWDSHPISSIKSLHSVGSTILRKLSSLPNSIPVDESLIKILGKPTRGSIAPSLRLVGNDLLAGKDHNVFEFITRSPEGGISGLDIMLSMANVLTLCDMNSPERRLYGALDIRLTEAGIKLCGYRATPYDGDKRFLVDPHHWTVTLTPAGAISHTHMDYYGRHQFFVHLFGHKIWLVWPPSQKNLEIYGKYHTQTTPLDLTSRCIDELEGLQVFYTTKEQAFVMMPNVLHACISISMSSHLGAWVLIIVCWSLNTISCHKYLAI